MPQASAFSDAEHEVSDAEPYSRLCVPRLKDLSTRVRYLLWVVLRVRGLHAQRAIIEIGDGRSVMQLSVQKAFDTICMLLHAASIPYVECEELSERAERIWGAIVTPSP